MLRIEEKIVRLFFLSKPKRSKLFNPPNSVIQPILNVNIVLETINIHKSNKLSFVFFNLINDFEPNLIL